MKGIIGFTTNKKSLVSKTIRWVTGCEYSHTFLCLTFDINRQFILEACEYGVSIQNLDKYLDTKHPLLFFKPKCTDQQIQDSLDKCLNLLDRGYGYFQLLGLLIKYLLLKFNIKIFNPIKKGIICTELVFDYCMNLFPEEFKNLSKDSVSDFELLQIIKNSKNFEIIQNP